MSVEPLKPEAVRACLGRRQSLPTLPTTFSRLMQVVNKENINVLEVTEIITYDPVLMANILRVANSSFMGLKEPVETLADAIFALGMTEIKRIAMSVGSFDVFKVKNVSSDFLKNIWKHSLLTGLISQQMAKAGRFSFSEEAYLAGLLHDLGKMFFATFFADSYAPLRVEIAADGANGLALETQIYGMNHLDAAATLCEHWKLPPRVAAVAANHHAPPEAASEEDLLFHCVAVANVFAHNGNKDVAVDKILPQAHTWLAQLAEKSSNPEALSPQEVHAIVMSEIERASRFEEVSKKTI